MEEITNPRTYYEKGLDAVKIYRPLKEQILLPEFASCLSVQAFLGMCKVNYEVIEKHNAEHMSPSGQVPVFKCGMVLLSELDIIVEFFERSGISLTKGLEQPKQAEMNAYISLVNLVLANAENYMCWVEPETYDKITKVRYGSVYHWPINWYVLIGKTRKISDKLKVYGWLNKDLGEVCEEVDTCLKALSCKLNDKYFFGNTPTPLDAVVFGHVYAILKTPMPRTKFAQIIHEYPNIVEHCQQIGNEYLSEHNQFT